MTFDRPPEQDETSLTNALNIGPVSVAVYAEQWQFYHTGVMSSTSCGALTFAFENTCCSPSAACHGHDFIFPCLIFTV